MSTGGSAAAVRKKSLREIADIKNPDVCATRRVMRERGLLVRSRRLRARRQKEWGRVEATQPNQIWQSDLTKIWAGPTVGWA